MSEKRSQVCISFQIFLVDKTLDARHTRYEDYVYPAWAVLFGYFFEIFPLLTVFLIMILDIKQMKGEFYQVSFATLHYKGRDKLKRTKVRRCILT